LSIQRPPASVLSILLCCGVLEGEECRLILYADDVCIFSFTGSLEQNLKLVENDASEICEMVDRLGLNLSMEKTKLCIFHKGVFNKKCLKKLN